MINHDKPDKLDAMNTSFIDKEILDWRQVVRQSMPWNRRHWMGQSTVYVWYVTSQDQGHTHTQSTTTRYLDTLGLKAMIGYDYEVVSCVKFSDLQWLSDLSVDLHSAGPSCSELLISLCTGERADRSSTQRSLLKPPSRAEAQWSRHSCIYCIYIYILHIHWIFIQFNKHTDVWYQDWGGQVDPVDIVLRGIGYVEEMQEVTTSEDPTNINNINKHQQT